MSVLHIDADVYRRLRLHGEETYPHECCGVLLGRAEAGANIVAAAVRADNTRIDSAHNRYQIAPAELIRIQREARAAGHDIVGFYHSHPDHPAQWSPTDLAEAHWLGCSYMITAVSLGEAAETNSFRLEATTEDDKRFAPEPILIPQVDGEPVAAGDGRC